MTLALPLPLPLPLPLFPNPNPYPNQVRTSGCPNHYSFCTGAASAAGGGARGAEGTASAAVASGRHFEIPASPVFIVAPSEYTRRTCDLDPIGVALNGVLTLNLSLSLSLSLYA